MYMVNAAEVCVVPLYKSAYVHLDIKSVHKLITGFNSNLVQSSKILIKFNHDILLQKDEQHYEQLSATISLSFEAPEAPKSVYWS